MNRTTSITVTLFLALAFVAAYVWLAVAVGKQSTEGTETGMLLAGAALIAYLAWLFHAEPRREARAQAHGAGEGQSSKARWSNFRKSLTALLLCIPGSFLFIGFLAPPFIVVASALSLVGSLAKRSYQPHGA